MSLVVILFTIMAVAMVWGLSLQMMSQLQAQMQSQTEARAAQLADAMAGQTQSITRLLDFVLLDLRDQWGKGDQAEFVRVSARAMESMPKGLVSHVTVADADGRVILDTPGETVPRIMNDRDFFQRLRSGDRLVISEPIVSRRHGAWVMVVARPIYRDNRFAGAVLMPVYTEALAGLLSRLTLSEQDLVAMVHPDGRMLARTLDNTRAMAQTAPANRPFMQDRAALRGHYRETSPLDGQTRLYAWQRVEPGGPVVVVGLSEREAMAPLVRARQQGLQLTLLLSLILAGIGAWIGWLQWRLDRGRQEMQLGRQRLQEAQRIGHMGHWRFDPGAGDMMWSDEVFRILGEDAERTRPGFAAYWSRVHPEDKPRLKESFRVALASMSDLQEEHRIVREDGTLHYVRLISRVDRTDGATVFRGTLQDVTELQEAQRALEQLNAGLEQRVRSRTRELVALNGELESFTYSVSHDLRTPLRSIQGFASLLQESEAARLSDEGRDFLQRILDSSRRMGLLITDLLSLAQHSRADIRQERVDLSALAQSVLTELERGDPGRQVQWDIEPGLSVLADPVLMRVVLQNLLGNAWKYTGQVDQARIGLHSAPPLAPGHVGFCVSDNGAGFDMKYAEQLFQPFKRLHAHQQFEGTGIGLATVARVVQRHGGMVRAEGTVGQGARFYFSVPKEPQAISS